MDNNQLIQIGLFVLAFVVVMKILSKDTTQENLEGTVYENPMQTGDFIQPSSAISVSPANALSADQYASTTLQTSAAPVMTSGPSSAITGANVPSPLTSVQETLLAAAPQLPPGASLTNESIFSPAPADYDSLFSRQTTLDPSELIPKIQDSELYAGLQPDPRLNQNFLNNRWSLGIETSVSKRNPIRDLRGAPPNPIAAGFTAIWNQPTQLPDVHARSICDIS